MKTRKSLKSLSPKAVFHFKRTIAGQPSGEPTTTLITTHPTLSKDCQ